MDSVDFDLDRSLEEAWEGFTGRLAEVLSMMDDDAELALGTPSADGSAAPIVRFVSVPGVSTTRGEPIISLTAESPDELPEGKMAALGWKIEHSGIAHRDVPQAQVEELAQLAVVTLRQVFGVHHPVFLSPDHLAEVLQPTLEEQTTRHALFTEGLNLQPDDIVAVMPTGAAHLTALVSAELEQYFGHPPVRDHDGDLAVRVGSSVVFVRVSKDASEVLIFSPIVHEIEGRTRAAEVLNDLNADGRMVRFLTRRDRVFLEISIFAKPFVPAHMHMAMKLLTQVADGIDDELAIKLHGRTSF